MNRIVSTLVASLAVLLLGGCVSLAPFRTTIAPPGTDCSGAAAASTTCATSTRESTALYDLHFVEFDDQGLQYPSSFAVAAVPQAACDETSNACLQQPPWAYQINNLIKQLNVTAADAGTDGITLIVFIHGWKHNASASDGNVEGFRKLLQTAALIEEHRPQPVTGRSLGRPSKRRIVGVYVSWRGSSTDVAGLKELTFWSRKTAAMHVAQGASRELFARLRGFKCVENALDYPVGERNCNRPPARGDRVKLVLIGHSFGGLILYNSISGSLIESMTHAFDANEDSQAPYWRFADLAVLINPAFESTRYTPLHNIASTTQYARYETPMLVTVTSTTDAATRVFFRWGRAFNTLFEQHVDAEEKNANRETVGHHQRYLTHRLEVADVAGPAACAGWKPAEKEWSPAEAESDLARNVQIEYENSKRFFHDRGENFGGDTFRLRDDDRPLVRDFCGGVRLTQTAGNRNVPVWNLSAVGNEKLLPDHSDIMEPLFVAFFRQLYMDSIFLKDMTEDIAQDPGSL